RDLLGDAQRRDRLRELAPEQQDLALEQRRLRDQGRVPDRDGRGARSTRLVERLLRTPRALEGAGSAELAAHGGDLLALRVVGWWRNGGGQRLEISARAYRGHLGHRFERTVDRLAVDSGQHLDRGLEVDQPAAQAQHPLIEQ